MRCGCPYYADVTPHGAAEPQYLQVRCTRRRGHTGPHTHERYVWERGGGPFAGGWRRVLAYAVCTVVAVIVWRLTT